MSEMHKILSGIAFLAILPLPYKFYLIVRVLICFGGVYLAYASWSTLSKSNKAILIAIAFLFNPLIPIHLTKIVWILIDIATCYYLFFFNKWKQHPC
ncbi:DUF6804 family protein [Polynucleobacter sp. MWH-UH23A]|uniref:DUF6804 family protein n=1 Tax=Polynucleobacter sp. MWH-UH23A TaxID=1855613 RepID=UPI0033651031